MPRKEIHFTHTPEQVVSNAVNACAGKRVQGNIINLWQIWCNDVEKKILLSRILGWPERSYDLTSHNLKELMYYMRKCNRAYKQRLAAQAPRRRMQTDAAQARIVGWIQGQQYNMGGENWIYMGDGVFEEAVPLPVPPAQDNAQRRNQVPLFQHRMDGAVPARPDNAEMLNQALDNAWPLQQQNQQLVYNPVILNEMRANRDRHIDDMAGNPPEEGPNEP